VPGPSLCFSIKFSLTNSDRILLTVGLGIPSLVAIPPDLQPELEPNDPVSVRI